MKDKLSISGEQEVATHSSSSAETWLQFRDEREFRGSVDDFIGPVTSRMLTEDPVYFSIYLARYKFVSRILQETPSIAEVGCGDGYGTFLLSQSGNNVEAFDIDAVMLEDCRRRMSRVKNLAFTNHDFALNRPESRAGSFDALVMVDVLEHIHAAEEHPFISNAASLLRSDGLAIFGTPNINASKWASENSRLTHVNLKSATTLRALLKPHFEKVLLLGQNDEVVHTGFFGMCHYLWAICFGPKSPQNMAEIAGHDTTGAKLRPNV